MGAPNHRPLVSISFSLLTMQRTFIALKPDAVQRGLIGTIIARFEAKGFKLVAMKMVKPSKEFAEKHYADLSSKPFFPALVEYFSSGPVVAMCWEGLNVIKTGRKMIGATNPDAAEPGSIRGDLCIQTGRNIIHGSDSEEAAKHEIALWFTDAELCSWESAMASWVQEKERKREIEREKRESLSSSSSSLPSLLFPPPPPPPLSLSLFLWPFYPRPMMRG